MELGREINHELGAMPVSAAPKKHTSYPSFNLSDEKAEEFSEAYDCSVGDELTATVKLRVSGLRKDEYGHSLTFDVLSIDDVQEKNSEGDDAEESDEPDEEEKVLGYKRPAGKNETPPLSDLSD